MLSPNFFYAVVPHGLRNKKNCVYRIVILYMHMYIHREKNLSSKLENSYLIYSKYLLCLRMIISIFPQNNVSINRKQIFVEDNIAFSLSFLESFTSTTLKFLSKASNESGQSHFKELISIRFFLPVEKVSEFLLAASPSSFDKFPVTVYVHIRVLLIRLCVPAFIKTSLEMCLTRKSACFP